MFQRGDLVKSNRELDWTHGSGQQWPAGQKFRIEKLHDTSSGPRYSANAITPGGLVFVSNIPPDAIEAA